ncbi:hypothetical protein [Halobacillus litoralis]|nr:hypothetical protein [Halobacillus litoralis]MCA1023907.1 hypothetical protein [Halobacillus litoralis]
MKKAFQLSVVGCVLMFSLLSAAVVSPDGIQNDRSGAEVMYDPGDPGIG